MPFNHNVSNRNGSVLRWKGNVTAVINIVSILFGNVSPEKHKVRKKNASVTQKNAFVTSCNGIVGQHFSIL